MKKAKKIYQSKRWQRKRAAILRRDKYECQLSKRYGTSVDAEMVHHIYPCEQYPELMYKDWNLIALSNKVHNTLHSRSSGELTQAGKELQRICRQEFEAWMSPPLESEEEKQTRKTEEKDCFQ